MRTLLFDADCSMCQRAVEQLAHFKLLSNTKAQSWQEASRDNPSLGNDPMLTKRIQTELLLLDNGQVYGGFYAIAELLKTRFPKSRFLLNRRPLLKLGQTAYSIVSFNRRILSPVGPLPCHCDPPFHPGYRLSFWLILCLLSLFCLVAFGSSLSFVSAPLARITFSGVAASLLILLLPPFYRRLPTLLPQLFLTLSLGATSLLPVALINWISLGISLTLPEAPQWLLIINLLGLLFPFHIMRTTLNARCQRLGFPAWTPWLWLALLVAGILTGLALFWK